MTQPNEPINVGDFVTILEWHRSGTDRSWVGDVLVCRAIDWPFLVMEEIRGFKLKFPLDIRQVELKKLSVEYVEALLPGAKTRGGS